MKAKLIYLAMIIFLVMVSCQSSGSAVKMDITDYPSVKMVRDMGMGMNIGNTLDALSWPGGPVGETQWGNPRITQEYIASIKNNGFKTVRLPVSWADYIGPAPNYVLEKHWLDRVEEVVNWVIAEDMYVIVNMHHDGGDGNPKCWIKEAQKPGKEKETTDKYGKAWRQIAVRFKDHSEKLILESMNEVSFDEMWNRYGGQPTDQEGAFNIFNRFNQVFVDVIRASGGVNKERCLLIAGYATDIADSSRQFYRMPKDTVPGRLILSVHYSTPSVFCILDEDAGWGKMQPDWGSPKDLAELEDKYGMLQSYFINNGYPVIVGEYGASASPNKAEGARVRWMTAVARKCLEMGICPILWDTGSDIDRYPPYKLSEHFQELFRNVQDLLHQ